MVLTTAQIKAVQKAAKSLPMAAATQSVEMFYKSVLGLNDVELADVFPKPDPTGVGAVAVSHLTLLREEILRDKCEVPTFVVHDSPAGYCITGLYDYYESIKAKGAGYPADFSGRLLQSSKIRKQLLSIDKGQKLEALAAALLSCICSSGEATKGSGDQGIDAIGTHHLIRIDSVFLDGELDDERIIPGQKVIILASSKAGLRATGGEIKIISPAHIRELIGGWLIQRSETSMWRHLGIQMLTPLQLLLVTTYRLSADSKADCNRLGVQVWSIPELTFLICKHAPPEIFAVANGFSAAQFSKWWGSKDRTRIYPKAA